jgi:hypothetical protein
MKTVEQYKCEICGGIYGTPHQAETCEAKHAKVLSVEVLFQANHIEPNQVKIVTEGKDGKRKQKTYGLYKNWY